MIPYIHSDLHAKKVFAVLPNTAIIVIRYDCLCGTMTRVVGSDGNYLPILKSEEHLQEVLQAGFFFVLHVVYSATISFRSISIDRICLDV